MEDKKQGWIDVEDRVPKAFIAVLCYFGEVYPRVGFLSGDTVWYVDTCEAGKHVTHWQPLPAAPEPKESKLLPCPFCAGDPRMETSTVRETTRYTVFCLGCGCATDDTLIKETAAAAWNKRT